MSLGKTVTLPVVKEVDFGVYLDAGTLGEVLLPKSNYVWELKTGDEVKVFLYLDSSDRPIATTKRPKAEVGQFAYLKVTDSTHFGAFLDWGLEKDVLLPKSEQHIPLQVDHSYLVYLYIDRKDGRITASSKIEQFLQDTQVDEFEANQAVDLIIANTTDLGFRAIVNHSHWGVLYKNEVFQRLSFGQNKKGFIKQIREDGKIDLSLQGGQVTRDKYSKIIENYLHKHNGFAPLHDKSDPKQISKELGMSKGAFKKAIGGLYKSGLIVIKKDGIQLVE